MKTIIRLTISSVLMALSAAYAQKAIQPQGKPSAVSKEQLVKGLEITVLSLQKAKEREILPHFNQTMRALEGYEFAVLTLNVKTLELGKGLDVSPVQLQDMSGTPNPCICKSTDLCDSKVGDATTCDPPFTGPEGLQFSKLQIEDVSFDLNDVTTK